MLRGDLELRARQVQDRAASTTNLVIVETVTLPAKEETMTTLENRPNTALLVVDVQNGVVEGAHERDAVVANIGSLVEKARQEHVPVVWVQHSDAGSPGGATNGGSSPSFRPTPPSRWSRRATATRSRTRILETVLSGLGVGRLIVVGAQTDACIRSTLHGAFTRGYDATLVSDAHTTEDLTAWGAPPPEGDRAHEPLLERPVRTGTDGGHGRDEGRRLRRRGLNGYGIGVVGG